MTRCLKCLERSERGKNWGVKDCSKEFNMSDWKTEIRRRLVGLKLEPTREAEIVEEFAQHLDDRFAELLGGGATREEASRAVMVELAESETLERELQRVDRALTREPV